MTFFQKSKFHNNNTRIILYFSHIITDSVNVVVKIIVRRNDRIIHFWDLEGNGPIHKTPHNNLLVGISFTYIYYAK